MSLDQKATVGHHQPARWTEEFLMDRPVGHGGLREGAQGVEVMTPSSSGTTRACDAFAIMAPTSSNPRHRGIVTTFSNIA